MKHFIFNQHIPLLGLLCPLFLIACHPEPVITPPDTQQTAADRGEYSTLYVLNEGNWGANKASVDIFDLPTGIYTRNVYAERNPHVVKELGDCGSDIQWYGNRLYAVINNSHKVEVMDAAVHRIAQVDINTPRYIAFADGKAYVTSYVPTGSTPNTGAVYAFDTASYTIVGEAAVGPQPDELVIQGNLLYCTCSGGYNYPDYDSTVSVVDRTTMTELRKITVGLNPCRIREDEQGRLWVLCTGNYADVAPELVVLDKEKVVKRLAVNVANMALCGDTLYYVGTYPNTFGCIRISTMEVQSGSFITDGTETDIQTPYGLFVNPDTRTVYVADAANYVSSGRLYGYTPQGKRIIEVTTGDVPGHLCIR